MSYNTELADAARRVRALNERLPDVHQVDVSDEWAELLEAVEDRPDWRARRIIVEWVEKMEQRLSCSLLNAPLDWDEAA